MASARPRLPRLRRLPEQAAHDLYRLRRRLGKELGSEAQLGVFRTLFHRVEGASLDPARSRDLIHGLAKEL